SNITVIGEGGITVGDINTTGGVTNGNVNLSVSQPIIVGGTITVTDGVQSGPGSFAASTATAGNISFSTINVGSGSVSLTGALNVANTITQTGGVLLADTLTISAGAGTATVTNATINTLNTNASGAADINLTNTKAIALGSLTGTSQDLTVTANGAITNTTNFTVDELVLNGTATAGNNAINLTGIVSATTSAVLNNAGAGNIAGSINTAALTLSSNGNIGIDTSNRFSSNATTISANAVNGNVFLRSTSASGVTIGASTASTTGGVFNLLADNGVTTNVGGTVAGANVVLTSTNGGFSLADSVTGTNSVTFTAATNILNTNFNGGINTNNLTLNSTGGSVGLDASNRFNTNVAFLSANAANSVFISNTNAGGVQIAGPSSAVNTFDLVAVNNITSTAAGDITADVVNLTAGVGGFNLGGTITGTTSVSLTAATNIFNTGFGGGIVTPFLSVTSTNGNIGSSANRFFTSVANLSANATAGNVFLSDGGLGINL
ncbi:MAG: S-layer family protein, partial [Propionibacteriaceae bacterium]|nr:S-layer family protein [Propionibacteriaceae bacterium]